jgi:putative membrane protein
VSDSSVDQHKLAVERTAEAKRRTHLANERTYAAWVRTALALVGLGVAISGYFQVFAQRRGQVFIALGLSFVLAGAVMAGLATYAYRKTYQSIERGEYGGYAAITLLLGAIPILIGLLALLTIVLW